MSRGLRYINRVLVMILVLLGISVYTQENLAAEIPESEFDDRDFYRVLLEKYDTDGDGILETEEAETRTIINICMPEDLAGITSLKGIEYFKNLEALEIQGIPQVNYKDISALGELTQLTSLALDGLNDVADYSALYKLSNMEFLSLQNTSVRDLSFLGNMPKLNGLILNWCDNVKDASIIGTLSQLTLLHIRGENLTDLSFLKSLDKLKYATICVEKVDDLSDLKSSKNTLTSLTVEWNPHKCEPDISFIGDFVNLESLWLRFNGLTELPDISALTKLTDLHIDSNLLDSEKVIDKLPTSITNQQNWESNIGLYNQSQPIDNIVLENKSEDTLLSNIVITSNLFSGGSYILPTDETGNVAYDSAKKELRDSIEGIQDIKVYHINAYRDVTINGVNTTEISPVNTTVSLIIPIEDYDVATTYKVYMCGKNGQLVEFGCEFDTVLGKAHIQTDELGTFMIVSIGEVESNTEHSSESDENADTSANDDVIEEEQSTSFSDEEVDEQVSSNEIASGNEEKETSFKEENKKKEKEKSISHILEIVIVVAIVISIAVFEIVRHKKTVLMWLVCLVALYGSAIQVSAAEIPSSEFEDPNFYNLMMEMFDVDEDGMLETEEAEIASVINIYCNLDTKEHSIEGITSLKGVEYFKNIEELTIEGNPTIFLYDISDIGSLTQLECLNIGQQYYISDYSALYNLINLTRLILENTNVEEVGFLSNMLEMEYLSLRDDNYLKDGSPIGELTKLKHLNISGTRIEDISYLNSCTRLQNLSVDRCKIYDYSAIMASKDTLENIIIGNYQQDYSMMLTSKELDFLREMTNLAIIVMYDSHIVELPDLTHLERLRSVIISGNHLTLEEYMAKVPETVFLNPNWREMSGIDMQMPYNPDAIGIQQTSLIDNSSNIVADGKFVNDAYIEATVEDENHHVEVVNQIKQLVDDKADIRVFDISVYKYYYLDKDNNIGRQEKSQPEDRAKVTLPITASGTDIRAFRQEEDGSLTELTCTVEDGNIVFYTDHFSIFSIATVLMVGDIDRGVDGGEQSCITDIVVISVCITCLVVMEILHRRKQVNMN